MKLALPVLLRKAALLVLTAITLASTSCSTIQPISAATPGSPAASAPRTMIVERPYSRHRLGLLSLPAGRYTAQFSDDDGAYYVAPTKIVSGFPVRRLEDGGFYASFKRPVEMRPYVVDLDSGSPVVLNHPAEGLAYHFER